MADREAALDSYRQEIILFTTLSNRYYTCFFLYIGMCDSYTIGLLLCSLCYARYSGKKMLKILEEVVKTSRPMNDWRKVVKRTKNIIMKNWERDVSMNSFLDREFIINVGDSDSETESVSL